MRAIPKWLWCIAVAIPLATGVFLRVGSGDDRTPSKQPVVVLNDGNSSDQPASLTLPNGVKDTAINLSEVADAIQAYSGDRTLYPKDLAVAMEGERYDLIQIRSGSDATYQIYDKSTRAMTSLPIPLYDYRIDAPNGESIIFVEGTRILKYLQNSETTEELALPDLAEDEFYSRTAGGGDPVIVSRTNDMITLQVFARRNGDGDSADVSIPTRRVTVSLR